MRSISNIYVNYRENEVLQRETEAQYRIGHSENIPSILYCSLILFKIIGTQRQK